MFFKKSLKVEKLAVSSEKFEEAARKIEEKKTEAMKREEEATRPSNNILSAIEKDPPIAPPSQDRVQKSLFM